MSSDEKMVKQHRVWEGLARTDPLWAILSDPELKGGKWELDEFFASGVHDVDHVLTGLANRGIEVHRSRALDFGCGVGRLTQALAAQFGHADGVDISETMIELARGHNQHGERCDYHVNGQPDLALFADGSFDFVLSIIVLQHNPPDVAEAYIREFVRVLAPGGVADFDMTSDLAGTSLADGSHRASLRLSAPRTLAPGESTIVRVTVTNASGIDWPRGSRVTLGNHWRSADGSKVTVADDGRTQLSAGLAAGANVDLDLHVTAPTTPGRHQLEADMVEEGVCWFGDRGSPTATVKVKVKVKVKGDRRPSGPTDPAVSQSEGTEDAGVFEMHGLPRERVEAAVHSSGAVIVHVEPSERGGDNWDGFRYIVRRPAG